MFLAVPVALLIRACIGRMSFAERVIFNAVCLTTCMVDITFAAFSTMAVFETTRQPMIGPALAFAKLMAILSVLIWYLAMRSGIHTYCPGYSV